MLWPFLLLLILQVVGVKCLHCWKCIGEDCEGNPEYNYRASMMTCRPETACMKVEYEYSNNQTLFYTATVRSCSMGPCHPVDINQYNKCLKNEKKYYVNGCIRRYCCDDTNLCNGGQLMFSTYFPVLCMFAILYFVNSTVK